MTGHQHCQWSLCVCQSCQCWPAPRRSRDLQTMLSTWRRVQRILRRHTGGTTMIQCRDNHMKMMYNYIWSSLYLANTCDNDFYPALLFHILVVLIDIVAEMTYMKRKAPGDWIHDYYRSVLTVYEDAESVAPSLRCFNNSPRCLEEPRHGLTPGWNIILHTLPVMDLKHSLGCIFVVSSSSSNPVETFRTLSTNQQRSDQSEESRSSSIEDHWLSFSHKLIIMLINKF